MSLCYSGVGGTGRGNSFGLSLILDILLPSDKQYEWGIFKRNMNQLKSMHK